MPQTPVFCPPTPMLSGHMPGGAHGILSLMTVVFVLPEGKCHRPRGVESAPALGLRLIASSPHPLAKVGLIGMDLGPFLPQAM